LIIGGGVIGLSIGIALLESKSSLKVIIAEKEKNLAVHASGRNSGVLHAGFYYSPESLKAKFCKDGNLELRKIAKKHGIPVLNTGKVIVARNSEENRELDLLYARGLKNGVDLEIKDSKDLAKFEPLAKSHERFLWSPTTGVSDPNALTGALAKDFIKLGGVINFDSRINLTESKGEIRDTTGTYNATIIVNAAGAQADRISRSIGVGLDYAMLPFMGLYRATESKNLPLKTLVYPVPNKTNPFLGVHFTLTIDQKVKIGPTAIPVFGREQYSPFENWSLSDIGQSLKAIYSILSGKELKIMSLARSEAPKFIEAKLVKESAELVPIAAFVSKWERKPPGIRAQLVHLPTKNLELDFVVDRHKNSVHILNAVSPGWTTAIPFGRWVSENWVQKII
jgi:L-2-hydroxyglutarate oxidase